ncbi:protein phosphatase 2C domain-containing protein [Amorphus orientalis]|uniref:PPM-type phosphatase domain-containing protein n=1 Tax=Amorphus orientalis TaxID=649198 RepID=A0AAE3VPG4_9HYPH|nr:protein phosphatase 2C domain-containing protein [Amorphus orientalis]MDQ0315833.1 hypothetical protein [Amorphus orientalis]
MASVDILDACSRGGIPDRLNEDAFGAAGRFAWVIDGATGVGDVECLDGPSDAAWLSSTASAVIAERIAAGTDDLPVLLDATIRELADRFDREAVRRPKARHQRPTGAILLARFDDAGIDVIELGDCVLLARGESGAFASVGLERAGREMEQAAARRMREAGATVAHPEVRRRMQESRDRHNTDEGYWIFGLDPEAAQHARRHRLDLPAPSVALLATDGFASLFEDYGRYPPREALDLAVRDGLAPLCDELRRIERDEDPDCLRYPRFKQSDDATALLVATAP